MAMDNGERIWQSQPLLKDELEANNKQLLIKEGDSSFINTFFNGANALAGVGMMSVAYALASAGWLSLLLLFVVAAAAFYAGLLIKRCMEADTSITTFTDIGERAFGGIGKTLVSVFMCAEFYLTLTGFLIMEGDNLHKLFPEIRFQAFGLELGGRESFVLIVALVIIPSVWLGNLSVLSYISSAGIVATVVILVAILWAGAFDGIGFHQKGILFSLSGVPTAASLFGLCYSGLPVFPTLYNSMEKKENFSKVLLLSFFYATIVYTLTGISGYLMFGSEANSEITLNLPTKKLSSQIATYTALINPLTKYALGLEPVAITVESWFPNYPKKRTFRMLLRTALVITQVLVALVFPSFENLMSLIGGFFSVTTAITIPCLCYLKISGTNQGSDLVLVVGTIVLSLLIAAFGTYNSLKQIIHNI